MNMQTLFPYIKHSSINICPVTSTRWLLYYFLTIPHIAYTCDYNIFKMNLCYSGNEEMDTGGPPETVHYERHYGKGWVGKWEKRKK